MLFINRLLMVGLLSVGIAAATTAQAENQLFEATWTVKAFGNDCGGKGGTPHCTVTTGDFAIYSNWAIPNGWLCNPGQPRCPYVSTPVDGTPSASPQFDPLGGSQNAVLYCTPYTIFTSGYKGGASGRPVKGGTVFEPEPRDHRGIPPLYRNALFFSTGGQPLTTACTATSTGYTTQNRGLFGYNKGYVQVGVPAAGSWYATVGTGSAPGFSFAAAPATTGVGPTGFRASGVTAEFTNIYPYIYSYTYANLRNDAGIFGKGNGPGSFNIVYTQGASTVASINVKAGKNKFGGVMAMLGSQTNKACYYRNGGCSLGQNNWRYEMIGASGASTSNGVITRGYIATFTAYYYQTAGNQTSTVLVSGARFPWTTGSVTLTAVGRGPHQTVHYHHGYDNRTTASGKGTIQLVTPVLTRWIQPMWKMETGGIGILRIKFIPEPHTWAMLVAGASLLCVGARMRGR